MLEKQLTQLIRAGLPPDGCRQEMPPLEVGDWDAVLAAAGEQGVTTLLYAALDATGALDDLPETARTALKAAYARTWSKNSLVLHELAQLLELLCARHQIPVVLLKGAALLHTIYPDRGWRPLSDIDLLVPQSFAAEAMAVLRANGYAPDLELEPAIAQRHGHEQMFVRQTGTRVQVDLHWDLYNSRYFRRRGMLEWHWEQTTKVKVANQTALVFRPEAQLLHLSAHLMLQHHHSARLLWTYDIARLLNQEVLEWNALLAAAQAFALLPVLQAALRQVGEEWGIAPPPAVAGARVPRSVRMAYAVATAQHEETRQAFDAVTSADVRTTMSMLFPAPAFMRERYRIAHSRHLPYYYAYRLIAGGYRTVRAAILNLAR